MTITRFAPSPTGYLHVGNARTAIFNFLITRKNQGKFILRIDDTDPVRCEQKYIDAIKEDLEWLGIHWDTFEQQSKRLERYKEVAKKLIGEGLLYECFETPEQLQLKRKLQLKLGRPPIYDRESLSLTENQKNEKRTHSNGYWRFKLNHCDMNWNDSIQGEVSINTTNVSDPVLIRADGQFLYTFASVIDDFDMSITDVVRGADHITNTATQIQLLEKLGGTIPNFSHHSLLTDENGDPFSKRSGDLSLRNLREEGIESLVILSHLSNLGSSGYVDVKVSIQQVIESFEITRFNRNPTKYFSQDLIPMNGEYFRKVPFEVIKERILKLGVPENEASQVWDCVKGNVTRIEEVADWWKIFSRGAQPIVLEEDMDFIASALSLLPSPPYNENSWADWIKEIKLGTDRKGKEIFMPLRRAITGQETGPDMSQCLTLFKIKPSTQNHKQVF